VSLDITTLIQNKRLKLLRRNHTESRDSKSREICLSGFRISVFKAKSITPEDQSFIAHLNVICFGTYTQRHLCIYVPVIYKTLLSRGQSF